MNNKRKNNYSFSSMQYNYNVPPTRRAKKSLHVHEGLNSLKHSQL